MCRSLSGFILYKRGYLIDISAAFLCRSVIEEVLCCCLHLSAAFDTINHSLLKRLHGEIFVRGTVLELFTSYLSCRFQQVLVGQCYSSENPLLWPRGGELRTQILKSHLLRTQSLKVLPLKPGIVQYIAMHATLTAGDFFLANFCPSGPFTCIFPKPIPNFSSVSCGLPRFLCRPAD